MPEEKGGEMRKVSFKADDVVSFKAGDVVSYKVGRGRGTGTIASMESFRGFPDVAIITTAKGRTIRRKGSELARS